jgi:integrase
MLRHATGFYLANAGQDTRAIQLYIGHKNIHLLRVIGSWDKMCYRRRLITGAQ